MGEPEPRRARGRALRAGIAAEHARPEAEVLARRQRGLQRVGMAEVVRLLAEARVGVAALQLDAARRERQKARDRAQQARFSGAVRPGDDERLARARLREKGQRKQAPSAPFKGEFFRAQAHRAPNLRRRDFARPASLVCVAARREFIYNRRHSFPPTVPETPPWPASTVSNARRSSLSAPRPTSISRSKPRRRTGSTGVSQLPFSMKIVLENLLRNEDGRTRQERGHRGGRGLARESRQGGARDRVPPGARADAGFHRRSRRRRPRRDARRDGQARRRSRKRSTRWCRSISSSTIPSSSTISAPPSRSDRTSSANTSRTRSATASSNGASRRSPISPSCRPAPASAIRSISNISRRPCGPRRRGATARLVEFAYPDTLVGTDSHTTMVNGLAVLGWGVGGIEAEAAMLGQPLSMLLPEVVGFKLTGELREGVTATDLVLTVTQMLRKKGVVGKFVEFFGPGLNAMSVADRATLANMAPEYGATCGLFPIDAQALAYLRTTSRKAARIDAGRSLRQGAGHLPHAPDARPRLHRHAGARTRRGRALARRAEAPAGPRAADRRQGGLRQRDDQRIQAGRYGRASATRSRGRTTTSATATSSSPRSPPAPTPPIPA